MSNCQNVRVKEKKRIDNKIIKSYFINDSIFDGVTEYFNLDNLLESKIQYNKGIKHGFEINYYSNGRIYDSSFYINGQKNGFHYVYDSSGQLVYKDYYFRGFGIGGKAFYKQGKPHQYIFSNFEKRDIYSCEYDSQGMRKYNGELLNLSLYTVKLNNQKHEGLFIYLISPPDINIEYTLGITDENEKVKKRVATFDNNRMFVDTILTPPSQGFQYYLSVDYNDKSNDIRKNYFNILDWKTIPAK